MPANAYCHGGGASEVIYHLAPVKDLGGGEFHLNANAPPAFRMSRERIASLLTLIRIQPYITRAGVCCSAVGMNLDCWRQRPRHGLNLSDQLSAMLNIPLTSRSEPWLRVPEPKPVAAVVLHRSPQRQVADFPWRRVVETYGAEAVFVGSREEHRDFTDRFGHVHHLHTDTYLELAQVIAGAVLFIGNQSSPAAAAEGLKANKILETLPFGSPDWNCHWQRAGVIHGYDASIELPPLSHWRRPPDQRPGPGRDRVPIRILPLPPHDAGDPLSRIWSHGGDVGDLLYALATVKTLGGGQLRLVRRSYVREPFSPHKVERLRPLLEAQPYVSAVEYGEEAAGVNLDDFRINSRSGLNVCDMVASTFGAPHYPREEPWLFCPRPNPAAKVVISRSQRYHGHRFPWRRVWEKYGANAVFVGLPDEHAAWQREFGPVRYYPTADWWELCRVIAGARLFIGNQSAPMALALGLCAPLIVQEVCLDVPDCYFDRRGVVYGRDEDVPLPDV